MRKQRNMQRKAVTQLQQQSNKTKKKEETSKQR